MNGWCDLLDSKIKIRAEIHSTGLRLTLLVKAPMVLAQVHFLLICELDNCCIISDLNDSGNPVDWTPAIALSNVDIVKYR